MGRRGRRRQGAIAFLAATLLLIAACGTPPQRGKPAPAALPPVAPVVPAPAWELEPPAPPAPALREDPATTVAGDADASGAPGPALPLRDGAAVFGLLRARLASEACHADDRVVGRWLSWYARAPGRLAANLERVLPLLALVLERVHASGLPGEFALLPIVESWYRPDARHAGTVGLWQFSAGTARSYGLRVDAAQDQRLSPARATEAALAHLADLLAEFGDWRLAVMAYNAGSHRLRKAHEADPVPASPGGNRPAGLSAVTYEHLAKLQALACLVREPERVGLELPEAPFQPLTPKLLLAMDGTTAAGPAARVHEVRRGDSLWAIARRHGVAVADLLRWNALTPDAVLQPGQRIRLSP